MKNFKIENKLTGAENWPRLATVFIEGNKDAMPFNPEKSEEYNEAVIQSWEKVAVLHVMSPKRTNFFIGFATKKEIQYLDHEFETDMKIGMRIGPTDIQFIAIPKNIKDKILLEVVEITTENDLKYKDLILI